jgi:hypothetical protein
LDIAIIYGHYNCALALYQAGIALKSLEFYQTRKDHFAGMEIDFEVFLAMIKSYEEHTDFNANKKIFKEKIIERDLIIDPNESWQDFFRSVILLEDAKVVPIKSLSANDLRRVKNPSKMKKWLNWRNCNYVECHPAEDVSLEKEESDIEIGSLIA